MKENVDREVTDAIKKMFVKILEWQKKGGENNDKLTILVDGIKLNYFKWIYKAMEAGQYFQTRREFISTLELQEAEGTGKTLEIVEDMKLLHPVWTAEAEKASSPIPEFNKFEDFVAAAKKGDVQEKTSGTTENDALAGILEESLKELFERDEKLFHILIKAIDEYSRTQDEDVMINIERKQELMEMDEAVFLYDDSGEVDETLAAIIKAAAQGAASPVENLKIGLAMLKSIERLNRIKRFYSFGIINTGLITLKKYTLLKGVRKYFEQALRNNEPGARENVDVLWTVAQQYRHESEVSDIFPKVEKLMNEVFEKRGKLDRLLIGQEKVLDKRASNIESVAAMLVSVVELRGKNLRLESEISAKESAARLALTEIIMKKNPNLLTGSSPAEITDDEIILDIKRIAAEMVVLIEVYKTDKKIANVLNQKFLRILEIQEYVGIDNILQSVIDAVVIFLLWKQKVLKEQYETGNFARFRVIFEFVLRFEDNWNFNSNEVLEVINSIKTDFIAHIFKQLENGSYSATHINKLIKYAEQFQEEHGTSDTEKIVNDIKKFRFAPAIKKRP